MAVFDRFLSSFWGFPLAIGLLALVPLVLALGHKAEDRVLEELDNRWDFRSVEEALARKGSPAQYWQRG
jgi:hypothetical protein